MGAGETLRWTSGGVILALIRSMFPRSRRPPGLDLTTPWGPRQLWGSLPPERVDRFQDKRVRAPEDLMPAHFRPSVPSTGT
jgi:hypothetical protein